VPKKLTERLGSPKRSLEAAFDFEGRDIRVDKLLLDPNNYRFLDRKKFKKKAVTRYHEDSVQRATLESLEQSYQLDELKQSILKNGYVPMERIIVVNYDHLPGHYVVLEGNRRVAALKSILKEAREGSLEIANAQEKSYVAVPCALLKSSGESLKHAERVIMGIRHIAGPKEWGAYQQALLVGELKDEEGHEFQEIGDMLGISSVEAARRYRAIGALKFMESDELFSKQAEPSFYRLFHELVSLPQVRERFGWSSEENSFVDTEKAREFFGLICAEGNEDAKLKTYMDVRKLKNIVGHTKAEDSLFDQEQPLSEALRFGEQGKKTADVYELLVEAKETLEEISFSQLPQLKERETALIDQIIELVTGLKEASKTRRSK
jgi:ParB-like chromosome segregation protein Spo0J